MKKLGLILACLLLATSAFAIDITIGGAAGVNYTIMAGSDWDNALGANDLETVFSPGFEAGIFLEIAINDMFSIQPEINVVQTSISFSGSETERTLFFEVAALARGNFGVGPGKFSVLVGPALQINPSGEPIGGSSVWAWEEEGDSSYVEFLGVIGLGYALPVGNGALYFDARFRRAFSVMEATKAVDEVAPLWSSGDARANIISIRVGYGFTL